MMNRKTILAAASAVCLMGCGSVAQVRDEIDRVEPTARRNMEAQGRFVEVPRFKEVRGALLPVTEVSSSSLGAAWLRTKDLTAMNIRNPTPLTEVLASISAQGVNISSDLPLDSIQFVGRVNATNAEAALRQILGASGLDYVVDDGRKLVIIKPLASRTWYVNIGRRSSTYSSNGQITGMGTGAGSPQTGSPGQNGAADGTGGVTSGTTGLAATQPGTQGAGTSSSTSMQTTTTAGGSTSGTGITKSESFWSTIERELDSRLNVPIPVPRSARAAGQQMPMGPFAIPGMPIPPQVNLPQPVQPVPGQGETSGNELYSRKKIGFHSLNPDTGAITVTAPHWILNELDTYLKRVQRTYSAELIFEGEMVLVTGSTRNSEGIDLQAFARWANGRYGAVVSNNSLGGLTLSFPNGNIPSVAANTQAVGGALLGIVSPADGLQIFNSYLEEMGRYSIKERPLVVTTHGVPGVFNTLAPRYYTTVSQTAVAGNTGAATQATNNVLQSKDFGTKLTINPQIDIGTELIRALIDLQSVIYAGDQNTPQLVSVGNTVQQIPNKIPLENRFNYTGEALLRDGDLIIVGGRSAETLQTDENGLPGGSGPIGGIFGTKTSTKSAGTYYFALKVTVKKR